MPIVEEEKQNTPTFSTEVMKGLASWKKKRERMIFILCGAAGLRIGEALGIEINKHVSPDFLTISIKQKIHHGRVEQRHKTANGGRQVDLHWRLPLSSRSSSGTENLASYSARGKESPCHRRTSSVAICTRPWRN